MPPHLPVRVRPVLRTLAATVVLALTLVRIGPPLRAAVSSDEQRIVDWLKGQQPAMVALLERAVKVDSVSENKSGVRAMGDLFADELRAIGLAPRWLALPEASPRAGHLFAERTGRRGKRVLLIGHLDTVLPGGTFAQDGQTGRGSGVNDMKGGDVVLIFALKALHAAGALEDTQLIVAMTGDEESIRDAREVTRGPLIESAKRSDAALAFETALRGEPTVARRGSTSWRLEVQGPTGHSSGLFSTAIGSGAIYETARILDGFHRELRKLTGLTANVGVIAGGAAVKEETFAVSAEGKENIIAPMAVAKGDLRAVSPAQLAEAEAAMQRIVAENSPRTRPALTFVHRYPPMAPEPPHLELLAGYDGVSRELGLGPVGANDPAKRGAGDIAFVAPFCPSLDGLGPYGTNAHAEGETVDLNSLVPQATRAALLIYRLTR